MKTRMAILTIVLLALTASLALAAEEPEPQPESPAHSSTLPGPDALYVPQAHTGHDEMAHGGTNHLQTHAMQPGEIWRVVCDGGTLTFAGYETHVDLKCTGEATPTPEPTATNTPIPEPTGTQVPDNGDIARCEHDNRFTHALAGDDCWYNHEHGDNPSEVDDLFGPVGDFYGQPGQPFPFAWQTCGYAGKFTGGGENFPECQGAYENDVMHEAYKWFVRRDLECFSQFENGCVLAFRGLSHADGHDMGAKVRFHSGMLEALVAPEARPDDVGLVRTGGWQDHGGLNLDQQHIDGFGPRQGNTGGIKLHYSGADRGGVGNAAFGDWYGGTWIFSVVPEFGDLWTYISTEPVLHGADSHPMEFRCGTDPRSGAYCDTNNSYRQIHLVGVALRGVELRWLRQNGYSATDANGFEKVNFEGYTDRYGTIVKDGSCTAVGLDCVPLVLQNYDPTVRYQYRGDYREYDTSPADVPAIQWPN